MIIHHHRSLEIRDRSSTGILGSQKDGIIEVITPENFSREQEATGSTQQPNPAKQILQILSIFKDYSIYDTVLYFAYFPMSEEAVSNQQHAS